MACMPSLIALSTTSFVELLSWQLASSAAAVSIFKTLGPTSTMLKSMCNFCPLLNADCVGEFRPLKGQWDCCEEWVALKKAIFLLTSFFDKAIFMGGSHALKKAIFVDGLRAQIDCLEVGVGALKAKGPLKVVGC